MADWLDRHLRVMRGMLRPLPGMVGYPLVAGSTATSIFSRVELAVGGSTDHTSLLVYADLHGRLPRKKRWLDESWSRADRRGEKETGS